MNCEQFEELAGAFALGALDEQEMREAAEHLRTCERHPQMAEFAAIASNLSLEAPEMDPPPALKSRLMGAVHSDIATSPAAPKAGAPRAGLLDGIRSWLSNPRSGYVLSGALAVLVGALVVWNLTLVADDDGGVDQTVVPVSGAASGQVIFVEGEDLAVMEVEGLAPLPPEQVYQVWAIEGGTPTSIGFLDVEEDGDARGALSTDPEGVEIIAVTIEPAPGVDQPTTEPIIVGEL